MRDEGIAHADAIGGQAIHVRSLEPWVAGVFALFTLDDTHGIPEMVIGDDENEIGFLLGGLGWEGEEGAESCDEEFGFKGHDEMLLFQSRTVPDLAEAVLFDFFD